MKAADTVMKPEELPQAIIENPDLPMGQAIAIKQAEISFKAGMREVVEWGTKFCPHMSSGTWKYRRSCARCWLAFLKEHGLEAKNPSNIIRKVS